MGILGHDKTQTPSGQGHPISTVRLEGNLFEPTENWIVESGEHCKLAKFQFWDRKFRNHHCRSWQQNASQCWCWLKSYDSMQPLVAKTTRLELLQRAMCIDQVWTWQDLQRRHCLKKIAINWFTIMIKRRDNIKIEKFKAVQIIETGVQTINTMIIWLSKKLNKDIINIWMTRIFESDRDGLAN